MAIQLVSHTHEHSSHNRFQISEFHKRKKKQTEINMTSQMTYDKIVH